MATGVSCWLARWEVHSEYGHTNLCFVIGSVWNSKLSQQKLLDYAVMCRCNDVRVIISIHIWREGGIGILVNGLGVRAPLIAKK